MPRLLTHEMLEALEPHWREQGAAIADELRPGVAQAEMQAATEPLGLSLPTEAIASHVAAGSGRATPADVWPAAWFPLSTKGNGAMMACDCAVPAGAPTPIRHVDHEFPDQSRTPVADSFGTVVMWWIEALDRAAWTYNRERRVWEEHPDRLPDPMLGRTGLV